MDVEKEKLPKGLSYPIQTGMIAVALGGMGIELDCSVKYYNDIQAGFTAHFWPPNPNVPYERLYITVGAVAGEQAAEIRQRMKNSVLPALINWLRGLLALPTNSPVRREKQVFHVHL